MIRFLIIPSLRNLLGIACLSSFVLLSAGCGGGGGGRNPGNQPGAANPDPAVNDPAANDPGQAQGVDPAIDTLGTGRVVVRQANGRLGGLPGVVMTSRYRGHVVDSVITDPNGNYEIRLWRGEDNTVEANLAGYRFEPPTLGIHPTRPEALPVVVGISLPPAPAMGRIKVKLTGDPAHNPLRSSSVETINAVTRETLETRSLAGFDSYSMLYPVGTQIIVTPIPSRWTQWNPRGRMVRVTPDEQTLHFEWSAEPPQRPTLRPPIAQATPRATPRPSPAISGLPFLRPPAATPTPTPRLIRPPVSQP